MNDHIHIRRLEADCIIGIMPKERVARQKVLIDLTLHIDTRKAAETDDIADTLDYVQLKDQVLSYAESSDHGLIETLADRIARFCLDDPRVVKAAVVVDKPGALTGAESVAVHIQRSRDDL